MRNVYPAAVIGLAGLALLAALGILAGEVANRWFFGGAMMGVLLLAYGGIVLVLRKMGVIGPRRAER